MNIPSNFDKTMSDYSNLISEAFSEFENSFPAIASPTFSKQETVTYLYSSIRDKSIDRVKIKFPWRSLFLFIPRISIMFFKLFIFSLFFRVHSIPKNSIYFRTYAVPRCFKSSELIDDYFRDLPNDLSLNNNVVLGYTSHNLTIMNRFRSINKKSNHIASDGLLTIIDLLILFYDYLTTAYIQIKKDYYLNDYNIKDDINNSLLIDYLDIRSFEAYVEKYKCKKLVSFKIQTFVYIFENQSWEKACCLFLKNHGVKLIGYQSSGWSAVFLNFFPTKGDMKRHPMPNIILTVGENNRKYLKENGNYSIPVESFCALRFSYLNDGNKYLVSNPNVLIFKKVLYAFPNQVYKANDVVNDLINIFGDTEIIVHLKFHPLYSINEIKGLSQLPINFGIVNDLEMSSLKDAYDCVLFNDNSFGIEALLNGVKSFQYSHDGKIIDDRFHYFELWDVNLSYQDLINIQVQISNGLLDKSFDHDAVSNYINLMYKPYNKSHANQFLEITKTLN